MPNSGPAYFPAMHGLRGLLCLWVFLLHLYLLLSLGFKVNAELFFGTFFSRIVWAGYIAVLGFFVLSGFFISHAYIRHYQSLSWNSTLHYLRARLVRIYPVHVFVLFVYAALVWGTPLPFMHKCFPYDPNMPCDPFSVEAFFKNLFLIHAWDWFPRASWNVNSWSISSEWAMYLAAPLLIVPLARIKNGYTALVGAFIMMLLVIYTIPFINAAQHLHQLFVNVLQMTNNPVGVRLYTTTGPGILEFGLIRVSAGFVCGCLLYKVFQSRVYSQFRWDIIGTLSAAVIIAIVQTMSVAWSYLLFVPLILSLTQSEGVVSRVLASRIMRWFGDVSYSFYMVHGVVIKLLAIAIPYYVGAEALQSLDMAGKVILIGFITGISLIASACVYYLVEEPCRRLVKNKYPLIRQTNYQVSRAYVKTGIN